MNIRTFRVTGLHGNRTLEVPFTDNRVVLAGINGLGKTTVMTLLYLLLSKQWRRLLEFRFVSLELVFDSGPFELTFDELREAYLAPLKRVRDMVPAEVSERLERHPELFARLMSAPADTSDHFRRLARTLDISPSLAERLTDMVQFWAREAPSQHTFLDTKRQRIADEVKEQVVYLPTYRRIERDLRDIFPSVEEQVRTKRRYAPGRPLPFIELVEFGMEDVARTFERVEQELETTARSSLTLLVGTYLRAVIRGEVQASLTSSLQQLDDATVQRILGRVEENTLSDHEKTVLRSGISRWRMDPAHAIREDEKYIAHFVTQLVALDRTLREKEAPVIAFRDVCNGYLRQKEIVYDERAYSISVKASGSSTLSLSSLSSGEKQIVSLFSHLFLDRRSAFIVLIDEPELSLSVDWQRKLLPDVLESGRCVLLAAATHSPFIFENSLENATIDLADCVQS